MALASTLTHQGVQKEYDSDMRGMREGDKEVAYPNGIVHHPMF
jgi:hypothetical protein